MDLDDFEDVGNQWLDMTQGPPPTLFSEEDFREILAKRLEDMQTEIRSYRPNALLNTGIERLADYFVEKYSIDVPILDEENSSIRDYDLDANALGIFTGRLVKLSGTRYRISVPFTGDPRVFNSYPSGVISDPTKAYIQRNALVFRYDQTEHDANVLAASYNEDLANVKKSLQVLAREANEFNSEIRLRAMEGINARRTKLLNDQGVAASLGIRLERAERPATYIDPQVRRRPPIVSPAASSAPYEPEPELEMAEYEHILEIMQSMTLVIERNPTTFANSDEPQIRDHFLVQLNGHYIASGETFNSQGKSDILIRSGEKNIFIAELKFWDGPKSATDALIQLLTRYTTWRDSKIALIILNRRRDFSAVLEQVPGAIEASEYVIKPLEISGATKFRYVLRHPTDANKQLLLTVMCFEVPRRD